jgi:hypothetical protein
MFSDARWGDDPRDRNTETHDRSDSNRDDDARTVGRGPGENARGAKGDEHVRDRQHDRLRDAHWLERDRDSRHVDPRDVFMKDLNLPRGLEREIVRYRGHEYTLRGSETRTLSTVGAFRVVPTRDLGDHSGREVNPRSGDLRHLREQKLIDTVRMDGRRDLAVVLTTRGRDLLESHRDHDREPERERVASLGRSSTRVSSGLASSNTTPTSTGPTFAKRNASPSARRASNASFWTTN